MKTFKELAIEICKKETKETRSELDITQVREVLGKAFKIMREMSVIELATVMGKAKGR